MCKACSLSFNSLFGSKKTTRLLRAQSEHGRSGSWVSNSSPFISELAPSVQFPWCLLRQVEDCNKNLRLGSHFMYWERNHIHNLKKHQTQKSFLCSSSWINTSVCFLKVCSDSRLLPCWFNRQFKSIWVQMMLFLHCYSVFTKRCLWSRNLNVNSLRKQNIFNWTVVGLSKSETMVYNWISTSAAELKSLCPSRAFLLPVSLWPKFFFYFGD